MARKIHELRGIVTMSTKGFVNGARKVVRSTREMRQAWATAGKDVAKAATRMTAATGAFAAFAVKEFAEFESIMVRVRGVTNTLGKQGEAAFMRLEAAARHAGATTRFTATQSAEAMEKLALAGLEVDQVIKSLPGALQLASAAQVDIATAADVAAKSMRAFGLDASQLTMINDTLVATFTRANTDLTQLAESIKPVGPVAASLGIRLETVTAVIAKLSDAGFQGSEAGTSLRNILSRLAGAVPEVANKLERMGIATVDARGELLPLFDILEDLEAQGLTTGEVMELFGMRGGPQMAALLQVGTDSLREFEKGTIALRGVAKRLQEAQLDTFAGQFDLLKSAISEVVISIGQRLAPVMRQLVNEFQSFVENEGPMLAETFVEAAKAVVEFGRSIIQWFSENRETVSQFVNTLFGLIKWVAEFMAEHPRLMAALLAFKVTGLLGINQAALSLGSALVKTGGALIEFGPAAIKAARVMGTARLAAIGLRAGLVGVALVAIGAAAKFTYELNPAIVEFNKQAEIAAGLNDEWAERFTDATEKMIDQANKINNMESRTGFLKKRLDEANVALEGYQNHLKSSKARAEELRPTWRSLGQAGRKLWVEQVEQTKDFENKVALAKDRVKELERALSDASASNLGGLGAQFNQLNAQFGGKPGGGGLAGMAGLDEGGGVPMQMNQQTQDSFAKKIAEAIEAQRRMNVDEGQAGTTDFADFIQMAMQQNDPGALRRFAELQGGTPGMANQLVGSLSNGEFSREQIESIAAGFLQKLEEMGQKAEEAKTRLETAKQATGNLAERFRSLREQFPNIELTNLAKKFVDIRKAFVDGKISGEKFARAMDSLKKETDKAVEAAKAKERQENRERMLRILRGQGTKADQEYVMRLRNAKSMEIFDQQLQKAFNNFIGLNDQVRQTSGQFEDLSQNMQNFQQGGFNPGSGFNPGGFGGGAPSFGSGGQSSLDPQASQQMFNSPAGQLAALFAELQTLNSSLLFVGPNSQRTDEIRNQIAAVEALIHQLQNPTPQFIGTSGDIPFEDPGLAQDGRSLQGGTREININAPNLTALRNEDVENLRVQLMEIEKREGLRQ